MTEPMCEICHDHYRTDYPDVPLIGAETFKTAHCPWCHSRAAAGKTQILNTVEGSGQEMLALRPDPADEPEGE